MGEHWSSLSPHSITHSRCGTMFGVLYGSAYFATTIVTYSILSSAHIHEHSINGLLLGTIWTHGECLQFATLGSESLTIWEVEFSSKCPPTEVKSLLIPKKNPGPYMSFFLPNLSRLVFINQDSLFIWDTQYSKLLLDTVVRECGKMSFSSDGHFFACGASGPEIYLWKVSLDAIFAHIFFVHFRPNFTSHSLPHLFPLCFHAHEQTTRTQFNCTTGHQTTRLLGY